MRRQYFPPQFSQRLFSKLVSYPSQQLCGECSCGKVGYIARGVPFINFYSHSTAPRLASGDSFLIASGFRSNQVEWKGNVIDSTVKKEYMPPNSSNPHFFCPCEKREYLGVDATRLLGFLAVNLKFANGYDNNSIPDIYRPNHHFFYADRVVNCPDHLPKWKTVIQGELIRDESNSNLPTANLDDLKLSLSSVNPQLNLGRPIHTTIDGKIVKDVLPLSPIRAPEPSLYHFPESDPPVNNVTVIPEEKIIERVNQKYYPSPGVYVAPAKQHRDVIIVGGGHNGLITSAYLSKHGLDTLVLERRHIVGGAAVTEEIIPGFKFSRASYLAGLLRPNIIKDLQLEKYGFKYLPRNPSSFTPTLASSPYRGKFLLLGENEEENYQSIAQFSQKDAEAYPKYEEFLGKVREVITPLLDNPLPFNPFDLNISWKDRMRSISTLREMLTVGYRHRDILVPFYELFTGPAQHLLDRWFESEILKTTLATDAVVGALVSLKQNGSSYVLLHHVMGEAAGKKGVWSYVEGGMGSISNAIAKSSQEHGTEIVLNATVKKILWKDQKVTGVEMMDGSQLYSNIVVSGCTPYHTFMELLPGLSKQSGAKDAFSTPLPIDFIKHLRFADYSCGAFKINCAVNSLPNFACYPNSSNGEAGPQHRGTIHFECTMEEIENCYREASMGIPSTRPVIEMTIPSSIDKTISPKGSHVVQLFIQFVPYDIDPKIGNWADEIFKNQYADHIFEIIDQYCPGFSSSVIGRDVLSPLDLEKIFGLQRGQICHSSLSLHQLAYARPMTGYAHHRTPLKGLYLCSAGAHPGGGVMGSPGKNCAEMIIRDL